MKTNLNKDIATTDNGTVVKPKGNINWKVRAKSPQFWIGLAGVVISPILAYNGIAMADVTTWQSVGDLFVRTVQNPFLLASVGMAAASFVGVLADPTTKGISDSEQAMGYEKPKE